MQTQPQRRTYQQGAIIVRDGDCGDNFFLIEKGSVEVYKVGSDGKKIVIGKIAAGGIFGEMAVIDGQARMASVAALEPTICRVFPPDSLTQKVEQSDRLVRTIVRLFIQNIRNLTEAQIQIIAPDPVAEKKKKDSDLIL